MNEIEEIKRRAGILNEDETLILYRTLHKVSKMLKQLAHREEQEGEPEEASILHKCISMLDNAYSSKL